ncbi:alpha/beta-hydrolase family protein [Candidatus Saccharibacteria bacterium]|nr:alpha/beta-hydrolase family protein [Candidatus Saccharibacteria bacterium]
MNNPIKKSSYSFSEHIQIRSWKPVYLGLLLALIFLLFSFLPSLLARPWYIQGVVSGLSLAIGYLLGTSASATIRWFTQREIPENIKNQAWNILLIIAPVLLIVSLFLGRMWQNEVRQLLGVELIGMKDSMLIIVSTILSFLLFFFVGQLFIVLVRKARKLIGNRVPMRIGAGFALVMTLFLFYFVFSGVVAKTFFRLADESFSARELTAPEGITQPASKYKSGSPESKIPWQNIGFQGRGFVGGGPSAREISDYTGKKALEPVRIYSGYTAADTSEARARLVVEELKRTDAFSREVLVVATPTGTGWIDPTVSDALEYMYDGDSAIVTQQYSYLPSWISFLVDEGRAIETGRALYDAVIEEWLAQPEAERPKLFVYGLSLGSYAGQEPFSGVNDIRRSVDGALFTGTPNRSMLWRDLTAQRDQGSPEWQPSYKNGQSVRFASSKQDILENDDKWTDDTRILYLQHANDPITWFDSDLLFNKPDWLKEKRGFAVSPATRWFPILTFFHIALDQAVAASAPVGHGHYYIDTTAYAWQAVTRPDGWTTKDSDRLQAYIKAKNEFEITTP